MPTIAAISIYVHDLDRAVDFYTKTLGFTVRGRPVPFIAELDHDGPALVLCQAEKPSAQQYPDSGGITVGLAVDNVVETAAALRKAGITVLHKAPEDFPGGKYVAVKDPSGNVIELLQFDK
jgi:lactoylglutathione lyase